MQILENQPLTRYHSFGVRVTASHFVEISSVSELRLALDLDLHPKLILGGGSNVLFSGDYHGLVIHLAIPGIQIIDEDDTQVKVKVGGGVVWHDLVQWSIDHGYGGLENLSLIPGTVGAAPIQNIGAYGVEFDQVFERLTALRISDKATCSFAKRECGFSYRQSHFKGKWKGDYVIIDVTLRLHKDVSRVVVSYGAIESLLSQWQISQPMISDVSRAVITIRSSKLPDPARLGNAGSFFKNPLVSTSIYEALLVDYPDMPSFSWNDEQVKIPAAWLIERCGWKGYRIGDAGIYDGHALVLVNHGSASGEDLIHLSQVVQESVQQTFGITLQPEVNII